MFLVIDNYDSFVHNLARYVRLAGAETQVVRNDAVDADAIAQMAPAAIVLSPGPGTPADAGCCVEVVRRFADTIPMLGVCLGCQAIVEAFGGRVGRAPEAMHGYTSRVEHDGTGLFAGVPSPLTACRYHSLAAEEESLPEELRVTAQSDDGVVMAIEHANQPVYGVQFHPEAILTEHGSAMVENFVRLAREESSKSVGQDRRD